MRLDIKMDLLFFLPPSPRSTSSNNNSEVKQGEKVSEVPGTKYRDFQTVLWKGPFCVSTVVKQ